MRSNRLVPLAALLALGACGGLPPQLAPTGTVTGTATLAGATDSTGVTVSAAGTKHLAYTASDGRFTLDGVPPGTYTLSATYEGYDEATASVTVVANETATAALVLQPTPVIVPGAATGVVTLAGQSDHTGTQVSFGLPGSATVSLAYADQDGHYTVLGLAPGDYQVTAHHDGYDDATTTVTVTSGNTASVPALTLQASTVPPTTGGVTGVATLAGQGDSSRVVVSLAGGTASSGLAVLTAADGRYALSGVLPGAYALTAHHDGFQDATAQVTVVAGMDATADLTLQPIVMSPVAITGPLLAVHGAYVHLVGSGFGDAQGSSTVRVGGFLVTEIASWSDTKIVGRVPLAVPPGPSTVTISVGAREGSAPLHVLPRVPIAASSIAAAIRSDGRVVVWGDSPFEIPEDLGPAVSVATAGQFGAALQEDGVVRVWGYDMFTPPSDLGPVVTLVSNENVLFALQDDGAVRAWGYDTPERAVPSDLQPVLAVAAGDSHALALQADGTVRAWGSNDVGETDVPGDLGPVTAVAAGWRYSLALQADGTLRGWGQLNGSPSVVPDDLEPVAAVAAGRFHVLARLRVEPADRDDEPPYIRDWSSDDDFEAFYSPVSAVAASAVDYSLLLFSDGSLTSWGTLGMSHGGSPDDLLCILP